MYTKADAIPSLDDDSGNVHSSPKRRPHLTLSLLLLSRLNRSCHFVWHKNTHFTYLFKDFIQQSLSLQRDWLISATRHPPPHVSFLKQTQPGSAGAVPPENLSTFAVKTFINKPAYLLQVSAVTSTDCNDETLVPWGTKGSLCRDIFHCKPQSHHHCCCHHQTALTE